MGPSKKIFFWKNRLARLSKVFMADDILLLHFRKVFMADDILLLHFRKVLLVELLLPCSRHPNSHHNINRKLNHVLIHTRALDSTKSNIHLRHALDRDSILLKSSVIMVRNVCVKLCYQSFLSFIQFGVIMSLAAVRRHSILNIQFKCRQFLCCKLHLVVTADFQMRCSSEQMRMFPQFCVTFSGCMEEFKK